MRLGQIVFLFFFFAIFRKYPVPSIDNIFVFTEFMQFSNNKPAFRSTVLFLNQRQVVIEQTRLLSSAFLCSELKLENIYSGVNFLGKKCLPWFLLAGTHFCGSVEKSQKLEHAKISSHTVLRRLFNNWLKG